MKISRAIWVLVGGSQFLYFGSQPVVAQDVADAFIPMQRTLESLGVDRAAEPNLSARPPGSGFSRQFPSEYRTIDGIGNNEANPELGAAEIPMIRYLPAEYTDGYNTPAGDTRPSARDISNAVCTQTTTKTNSANASDYLWQWGQFLDHDIDETPGVDPEEPFDILVPAFDEYFDPTGTGTQVIAMNRSAYVDDEDGVRYQVNAITSFLDASNVYGSDQERADALRTNDGTGMLKTTPSARGPLLPYNEEGFPNAGGTGPELFLAGDVRANEQVGLTCMHTLFVREHNYWAAFIARRDPSLSGDDIYELSRIIVAAEEQAITYKEFLPLLLGSNAIPPYAGYDPAVDASIANVFATSAYRVGHTMLSPVLQRLNRTGTPIQAGPLELKDAFFNPAEVVETGIEPFLRGLAYQPAQSIDTQITDAVRNFLFGDPGQGGFDLASLNIQRGREHGLPNYNAIREGFGLAPLASFAEYPEVEPGLADKLEALYGTPDNMDSWIGLLGESHVPGALVGETLRAVLADQFIRMRDGDRFWYQNYLNPNLQRLVDAQSLSTIIRRNTSIGREIPLDVFRVAADS